ncbi:MAG: DUF481 domain-containing protein [Planctomycetes bacterium]|nr:DUF481 domain-containing protein [Planctomycetota bacterium]
MQKPILTHAAPGVVALALLAAPAFADEILLKNGERVLGKVTGAADGALKVTSESLGAISIPLDKIKTFSTDEPIDIHFADGTVVHQKALAGVDGQIRIEKTGVLQGQGLPITQIGKINPPPVKWVGDISAGLIMTRGNADTNLATVDFNANRRSEDDRITFNAGYLESRIKNKSTHEYDTGSRLYRGALKYDYFVSKKIYFSGFARAEKDAIANLDLRLVAGAGLGEQWVESGTFNFRTEQGLTWFYEDYRNNTPTNDTLALRLAYAMDGKFSDSVNGFHTVEWFPGLESADDHFVDARWGLRASLTSSMFAEARVELRYDNTPASGAERTDVRYVLSVGLSF